MDHKINGIWCAYQYRKEEIVLAPDTIESIVPVVILVKIDDLQGVQLVREEV